MGKLKVSLYSFIMVLLIVLPSKVWATKNANRQCSNTLTSLQSSVEDLDVGEHFPEDLYKFIVNTQWSPQDNLSAPPFSIVEHEGKFRMAVSILGSNDFNPLTFCVSKKGEISVSAKIYGSVRNIRVKFSDDPNYIVLSSSDFGTSTYKLHQGKTRAQKKKVLQAALTMAN